MPRKIFMILIVTVVGVVMGLGLLSKPPTRVLAEPEISTSSVHAGCYLAKADQCKIHVEPFTITVATGRKLVLFNLFAKRISDGTTTMIYDFRPDASNPLPISGDTITPSLVAKDFAARCGETYTISLRGSDTVGARPSTLGVTDEFTCPKGTTKQFLPVLER